MTQPDQPTHCKHGTYLHEDHCLACEVAALHAKIESYKALVRDERKNSAALRAERDAAVRANVRMQTEAKYAAFMRAESFEAEMLSDAIKAYRATSEQETT